jgi:hypothetical protein
VSTNKYVWEVDSAATLSRRSFKLKPKQLIERAKEVLNHGLFIPDDLAEDFVFQFPIIGPLSKNVLLKQLKQFNILDVFPDTQSIFYNFHVDPFQPNRVWFVNLFRATHTKGIL